MVLLIMYEKDVTSCDLLKAKSKGKFVKIKPCAFTA